MPVETTVHANRMVLMKLQKRLAMARRGHTLMKHKLDELVHLFQQEIKEYEQLRQSLEEKLQLNYAAFVIGMGLFRGEYQNAFLATPFVQVSVEKHVARLLNLKVPEFKVNIAMETPPYSLMETNSDVDRAV